MYGGILNKSKGVSRDIYTKADDDFVSFDRCHGIRPSAIVDQARVAPYMREARRGFQHYLMNDPRENCANIFTTHSKVGSIFSAIPLF